MYKRKPLLVAVSSLLFLLQAPRPALGVGQPCLDPSSQPITSCSRCLWRPDCEWCPYRASLSQPAVGCVQKGSYLCPRPVVQPQPTVTVRKNRPLSQTQGRSVQLAPQLVDLVLSPNRETRVKFDVALADVPVDIYFVMDLSNSMRDHKTNLVNAAESIARQVTQLTTDYQFGFGSFSDKPTPPFSSELSYYARNRHRREQPPPYSFHHQLPLTRDTDMFKEGVQKAPLAGNIDSPEAGLDALMQAITCSQTIGWRDDVRKVIIFITDEDTHFAYDGKLAGLAEPQDNQCHLAKINGTSQYTYELRQDYPSFSQIREQLNDKNMVVVFAVQEKMEAIYSQLSRFIQGTENLGFLTKDPSSLRDIVDRQYREIKSRIVLSVNASDDAVVLVGLNSTCRNPSQAQLTCSKVTESEVVHYEAGLVLKPDACQMDVSARSVQISLAGFQDQLTVRLACEECDCDDRDVASGVCNGHGDLKCGGCECYPGYLGPACECNIGQAGPEGMSELTDQCRQPEEGGGGSGSGSGTDAGSSDNSVASVCNGRGKCFCGQCQCSSDYLGKYCQCHRDQCPQGTSTSTGSRSVCSGHGLCQCNERLETTCQCDPGWSGRDCSCPLGEDLCRDAYTGLVCFGRGRCECGRCVCDDDDHEGRFCQRSTDLTTCEKLEPCVKLHQFKLNGTDAGEIQEYWREECERYTTFQDEVLFGQYIEIGCPFNGDNENQLLYREGIYHDCGETLRLYGKSSAGKDGLGNKGNSSSLLRIGLAGPPGLGVGLTGRGDLGRIVTLEEEAQIRRASTAGMERCVGNYDGCEFTFYHDNLESDEYFEEKRLGSVFVIHRNVSHTWQAITTCSTLPLTLIIGSTVGTLFLVGVALLVATVVLININDLRRWQQYQAWKAENERQLGEHRNPLYQEKQTAQTFQNPAFSEAH